MYGLIKKFFFGLLSFSRSLAFTMANGSVHSKCLSLSNQLWMTRPTLIDLNPNEYNRRLRDCLFMVNLDRCNGSCKNQ